MAKSRSKMPRITQTAQQVPQNQIAQQPQPTQPSQSQPTLQPGTDLQTTAQASATLDQISSMSDDQLAQVVRASQTVDMPNFLNDLPDPTQRFVYQIGLNGAPTVVDQTQFDQFMKQNGIRTREILSRSVNSNGPYSAKQITDVFKYSELNYIGGKHGGQVYGAGTYFDMNGGGNTGYGHGATINAVLNPHTAKVITSSSLHAKAISFANSHPKFANAVGSYSSRNMSIYALAMGYNVINNNGSYYNIIDRSAVVVLK